IEVTRVFKIHFKNERVISIANHLCDSPDEISYTASLFYNTSSIQSTMSDAKLLSFYTDDSLDKAHSEECKMGSFLLQTTNPLQTHLKDISIISI
ncbi:11532_t:CDS:2, partial [Funneliformis geosporum]